MHFQLHNYENTKSKHYKYDIFIILFCVFIIMYLKMHYYIKVYNFFLCFHNYVNALLDVLFSHFRSHIVNACAIRN